MSAKTAILKNFKVMEYSYYIPETLGGHEFEVGTSPRFGANRFGESLRWQSRPNASQENSFANVGSDGASHGLAPLTPNFNRPPRSLEFRINIRQRRGWVLVAKLFHGVCIGCGVRRLKFRPLGWGAVLRCPACTPRCAPRAAFPAPSPSLRPTSSERLGFCFHVIRWRWLCFCALILVLSFRLFFLSTE